MRDRVRLASTISKNPASSLMTSCKGVRGARRHRQRIPSQYNVWNRRAVRLGDVGGLPRQSGDFGLDTLCLGRQRTLCRHSDHGSRDYRDEVGKVVDPEINPSLYAIALAGSGRPSGSPALWRSSKPEGSTTCWPAPWTFTRGFAAFICKARQAGEQSACTINPQTEPAQAGPGRTVPPNATAAQRNASTNPTARASAAVAGISPRLSSADQGTRRVLDVCRRRCDHPAISWSCCREAPRRVDQVRRTR